MELKEGELHIWRCKLDHTAYQREETEALLSAEEKEQCSQYLREEEKIRYTCVHRFVRQVLARYLQRPAAEIEFSRAPLGKPFVRDSGLFFSYSYRSSLGLLALSQQGEVGVDLEKIKLLQDPPTFASFSFSEREKEMIFGSRPESFQDTLFTFWTFKEAVIKALGVGLNTDLTQLDLFDFFYSETNPLKGSQNALYTIKRLDAPQGYKAAVAIQGTLGAYQEFTHLGN